MPYNDRDPFSLPDSEGETPPKEMEVKGVTLSMEEIESIQRGSRFICEQYRDGYSTWPQVLTAVILYNRLETLKQYAKPV